jgi:hypothetical protein
MQSPTITKWTFNPSLDQEGTGAFDMAMMVQLLNVHQLAPFSLNGIYHKMTFKLGLPGVGGAAFVGSMGPQVHGGSNPGDTLPGRHFFEIQDTALPSAPGARIAEGRWLALPSTKRPGDIGTCKRACVGCAANPELMTAGSSSGVDCGLSVAVQDGSAFVYRIHKSSDEETTEYDGVIYAGPEWVINVRDMNTGSVYTIGRFITEGFGPQHGIVDFSSSHEHLGCAPCDAYYQATRVTGPFVLRPAGVHYIQTAETAHPRETDTKDTCRMQRAVGLGGLGLLYESGPTVQAAERGSAPSTVYSC